MSARLVGSTASQNAVAVGGLLLAAGYLFWTCNALAPQLVPGASNATVSYGSLIVYGIATLLLAIGVLALIRGRPFSGFSRFGGLLLVVGFLLWAFGAALGPTPIQLPWWFVQLSPLAVLIGSALFGPGAYSSQLVNRSAALLIGVGGTLGMLLIEGPELLWQITGVDLAPGLLWHALGFLLLMLFGVGWVVIGRSRAPTGVRPLSG
jgi:hypothetical protein